MHRISGLSAGIAICLMLSCSSLSSNPKPPLQEPPAALEFRNALLKSATSLIGNKPEAKVTIKGKAFILDCIGTVRAAYWGAGLDISADFGRFSGNGVGILYQSLEARQALLADASPGIGDIVFWDNTWDRNGDGVFGNDPLTHAGIVVALDSDGTITYLHADYSRGVVLASMNLSHPGVYEDKDGKIINTPLYMGSGRGKTSNPPRWLSGDLWKAFGGLVKIRQSFET